MLGRICPQTKQRFHKNRCRKDGRKLKFTQVRCYNSVMFSGRVDRISYLLGGVYILLPYLAIVLACIIFYAIFNFGLSAGGIGTGGLRTATNVILFAVGALSIFTIIPLSIGLSVRRWHDIGQSGWLTILSYVPFVGWIPSLILLFMPGTKGPNNYGNGPVSRGFMPVLFGKVKVESATTPVPPSDPLPQPVPTDEPAEPPVDPTPPQNPLSAPPASPPVESSVTSPPMPPVESSAENPPSAPQI